MISFMKTLDLKTWTSLFQSKDSSTPSQCGLFMDSHVLTLVETVFTNGIPKIRTRATIPWSSTQNSSSTTLEKALSELLRHLPSSCKTLSLCLNPRETVLRLLDLSNVPRNLISADIVRLQAERFMPLQHEDMLWDYRLLKQEGKTKALLAGCKRSALDPLQQALGRLGYTIGHIELMPTALLRVLRLADQTPFNNQCAIVWLRDSGGSIGIFSEGVPLFFQSFGLRPEDIQEDRCAHEIHNALQFSRNHLGLTGLAKLVVMAAPDFATDDWLSTLGRFLKVPIERFVPVSFFQSLTSPQEWVALGLSLYGKTMEPFIFTLMQKDDSAAHPSWKWSKNRPGLLAVLFLILWAVMGSTKGWQYVHLKNQLSALEMTRAKAPWSAGKNEEDLALLEKQVEVKELILQSVLQNRVFWTEKLRDLRNIIQSPVWLHRLEAEDRLDWAHDDTNNFQIKNHRSFSLGGSIWLQKEKTNLKQVEVLMDELRNMPSFNRDFPYISLTSLTTRAETVGPRKQSVLLGEFDIKCFEKRPGPNS